MSKIKEGHRVAYDVHPTPHADGKPATYHARRLSATLSGRYLRGQVEKHSELDGTTFDFAIDQLKKEIPEQLLNGHDIHIEGLGTFYLKIGMKKKAYIDPKAITPAELKVTGIGFTADKEFQNRVRKALVHFELEPQWQSESVDISQMETQLTEYCQRNDFFTVKTLQGLFHLTKSKASEIANALVSGPDAHFVRRKVGNTYIYTPV